MSSASHRKRCRTRCATPMQRTSSYGCAPTTAGLSSTSKTTESVSIPMPQRCDRVGSGSRRWRNGRSASAPGSRSAPSKARGRPYTSRPRMPDPIRVLIVDDHAVVREGLRNFLDLQDGMEIAGEAGDGAEGLALAAELQPDVVLMDLVMRRLDGVAAMRALRQHVPGTRVIVRTSFVEDGDLL